VATATSAAAKPATLASGTASANAAANSQGGTVIIQFHGPIYGGPKGLNEMISKISDAVKFNRQYLVASHTVTGKAIK
jgi:hypothetical protein